MGTTEAAWRRKQGPLIRSVCLYEEDIELLLNLEGLRPSLKDQVKGFAIAIERSRWPMVRLKFPPGIYHDFIDWCRENLQDRYTIRAAKPHKNSHLVVLIGAEIKAAIHIKMLYADYIYNPKQIKRKS